MKNSNPILCLNSFFLMKYLFPKTINDILTTGYWNDTLFDSLSHRVIVLEWYQNLHLWITLYELN